MCMDGFMFGSCCIHDTRDNDIASSNTFPSPSYSSSSSSYPSSSSYHLSSNPYPSSSSHPSSSSSYSTFYPSSSYPSVSPTKPPYSPKTTPGWFMKQLFYVFISRLLKLRQFKNQWLIIMNSKGFTSLSSGNTYYRPPRPKRLFFYKIPQIRLWLSSFHIFNF